MALTHQAMQTLCISSYFEMYSLGRGVGLAGASRWSRTTDAGIFNPSLYLLSYRGIYGDLKHPLALLEPQMGLEPTSNGLEDRGSSIELLRRS